MGSGGSLSDRTASLISQVNVSFANRCCRSRKRRPISIFALVDPERVHAHAGGVLRRQRILSPPTRAGFPPARVFLFTDLPLAGIAPRTMNERKTIMRFRWIGMLTLWTFLSGPILALPGNGKRRAQTNAAVETKKPSTGSAAKDATVQVPGPKKR